MAAEIAALKKQNKKNANKNTKKSDKNKSADKKEWELKIILYCG